MVGTGGALYSIHLPEGGTAVSADPIRSAYEALGQGDPEPLVSLMSEEMEWRGRKRGWRFWEPPPS